MQKRIDALKKINVAIDRMDEIEINAGLSQLKEENPISPQDAKAFAAKILTLKKEKKPMNKSARYIRIAIAAAAVLAMGIAVYAAATLNLFGFQKEDKYVTMRTTVIDSEEEARELVEHDGTESIPEEIIMDVESEDFTFDSAEQATKEMDMVVPIPSAMPEMELDSADGTVHAYGEGHESRMLWLSYSDMQERMLSITVSRNIIPDGLDVTAYTETDMDEGSLDSYKSKSGIEYTLIRESGDSGENTADIATVMMGEYEYALVFVGFDEAQRNEIIDSADLSAYR